MSNTKYEYFARQKIGILYVIPITYVLYECNVSFPCVPPHEDIWGS